LLLKIDFCLLKSLKNVGCLCYMTQTLFQKKTIFFTVFAHVVRSLTYTHTFSHALTPTFTYLHAHAHIHTHMHTLIHAQAHTHLHTRKHEFEVFVYLSVNRKSLKGIDKAKSRHN